MNYQLKANVTNPALVSGRSTLFTELPTLGNRAQTNSVVWSDEETTFSWVDVPVTSMMGTVYQR